MMAVAQGSTALKQHHPRIVQHIKRLTRPMQPATVLYSIGEHPRESLQEVFGHVYGRGSDFLPPLHSALMCVTLERSPCPGVSALCTEPTLALHL
jgi:hypothetical protein